MIRKSNRYFVLSSIIILIITLVVGYFLWNGRRINGSNPAEDRNSQGYSTASDFEVLPIRLEDLYIPPRMYGLWPYGVKGRDKNSHNEGHPGWDFELKKGAKVYAIGDLTIDQIHDGDMQAGGGKIQVIEASSFLGDKRYHIVYHSVVNLEPTVKEGAKIKAGLPLAEAGYPLSENSTMIHFGIFPPFDSVGSCPTAYFSKEAQKVLAQIVKISINNETNQPFTSACLGKINRKLYEQNYPERLKDLGGAEPFE